MIGMIDTHAHLCDRSFDGDRAEVVARARAAGVVGVVAVGETLDDARVNLALAAEQRGFVLPAVGLFPTILDFQAAERICELIRGHAGELVAIGEVGLDRWQVKDEADREIQRQIFSQFIDLSLELDLPLNVHSRSAGSYAIELLLAKGARRVQLHAFDGKASKALPAVEAGFLFSVPPAIVRSVQKRKLVKRLPLDALLLETDSPVLSADGESRNEPANVRIALETIAEIKELSVLEVAERVWENTSRLYGPLEKAEWVP